MINQTADTKNLMADATALYDLYNVFGRGRVPEHQFIAMYLEGKLPEFIKRVCENENH